MRFPASDGDRSVQFRTPTGEEVEVTIPALQAWVATALGTGSAPSSPMLQPPTSHQRLLQSMQLTDKAGVHKEGQQLLVLAMYQQGLGLLMQLGSQKSSSPAASGRAGGQP